MKLKLIKVKDYLLLIDEEAEIRENDFGYEKSLSDKSIFKVCKRNSTLCFFRFRNVPIWLHRDANNLKKIIGYYPLNSEAKELDLPLLPNPFEENMLSLLNKDIPSCFSGVKGHEIEDYNKGHRESWIKGYKAAQSKQFSLEDMKEAIAESWNTCEDNEDEETFTQCFNRIIQSLSTKQLPKEFIPDTEIVYASKELADNDFIYEEIFKTITNSEGKEELVGTWKY